MSLKWTSQNIKLESVDSGRICSARLQLTRNKDIWTLKFNAFWLKPQSAELWLIGNNAKMLLKFDNVTGNYTTDKEFKATQWDTFFYNAQCCALYSSGKVIMKGMLSGASPLSDMAMQTIILSARRQDNMPIPKERTTPKKTLEFDTPTKKAIKKEVIKDEIPKVASIPVDTATEVQPTVKQEETKSGTNTPNKMKLSFDIPRVVSDKDIQNNHQTDEVVSHGIKQEEPLSNTPSIKELSFDIPKVVSDKGFLKKHQSDEVLSPNENLNTKQEFDIPVNHIRKPESVLKDIAFDTKQEEAPKPQATVSPLKDIVPVSTIPLPDIIEVDLRKNKDSEPRKIEVQDTIPQDPIATPPTSSEVASESLITTESLVSPNTAENQPAIDTPNNDIPSKVEATQHLPKLNDIKKMLARKPIDRTTPPVREVKVKTSDFKPVKCDFMLWDVERIESEVDSNPTESPFVGTFKGSRFARVEIATKDTFDHLLVGKVPLDNIPVYMLCIPGSATNPPIGVEGFGRWIPTKDGKGYWVKYITK